MKIIIIESPFANLDYGEHQLNIEYARRCMRDSLMRGEAPFASHLLYPQPHVLDDAIPEERKRGIDAGYGFWKVADLITFYTDRGWSSGMLAAYERVMLSDKSWELRALGSGVPMPPKITQFEPVSEVIEEQTVLQKHLKDKGWDFYQIGPDEGGWIKFDSNGIRIASQGDATWMKDLES